VIKFEIKRLTTAEQTEDWEQGYPLILDTATMNSPFAPETKFTSEDPAKKWLMRWRKRGYMRGERRLVNPVSSQERDDHYLIENFSTSSRSWSFLMTESNLREL
jgi:hypothetical protein